MHGTRTRTGDLEFQSTNNIYNKISKSAVKMPEKTTDCM